MQAFQCFGTIDPEALQLIETCASVLDQQGLGDVVDELVALGVFADARTLYMKHQVAVIGLTHRTELLLRELVDVAQRPGWRTDLKRDWMRLVVDYAGFTS